MHLGSVLPNNTCNRLILSVYKVSGDIWGILVTGSIEVDEIANADPFKGD